MYPPPGPVPPGPRRSTGMLLAALTSAAFVIATVIFAIVAHNSDDSKPAAFVPNGSVPPYQSGANSVRSPGSSGGNEVPVPSTPSFPSPSYSTPTYPSPTYSTSPVGPPPLEPAAINRTFQLYMDALLHRDLQQLKQATCPRLRHTETGTALHGKYIYRWKGKEYQIPAYQNYVTIQAKVYFEYPQGGKAGTATYSWYVERAGSTSGSDYYVCGFLS